MRALLDVNVLLALFDEDHINHEIARDWLVEHVDAGWSSCPITENGFVRIVSQPAYPGHVSTAEATRLLEGARVPPVHAFWPADVSLLDSVDCNRVHGPKQVTDLYLLALATAYGGRLVTFDERIPINAVPAAKPANLAVITRPAA